VHYDCDQGVYHSNSSILLQSELLAIVIACIV
jgi:hypothetical protein